MKDSYIILLTILIMGILTGNKSLSVASTVLILLKLINMDFIMPKLEAYGLNVGLIILTIGILAPIAEEKYTISNILSAVKSPMGISALLGGTLIIFFTGKGYKLLTSDPTVVLPIILGSILGVVVFKGVPVGPLVSAGLAFAIYSMYQFIVRLLS